VLHQLMRLLASPRAENRGAVDPRGCEDASLQAIELVNDLVHVTLAHAEGRAEAWRTVSDNSDVTYARHDLLAYIRRLEGGVP
jgi:hypothetical protein